MGLLTLRETLEKTLENDRIKSVQHRRLMEGLLQRKATGLTGDTSLGPRHHRREASSGPVQGAPETWQVSRDHKQTQTGGMFLKVHMKRNNIMFICVILEFKRNDGGNWKFPFLRGMMHTFGLIGLTASLN